MANFHVMNRLMRNSARSRCSGLSVSKQRAFGRGDQPGWHDLCSVLDDAPSGGELVKHDVWQRHGDVSFARDRSFVVYGLG